jgi:hypothetical protein
MEKLKPESELEQLRKKQRIMRQNEIFGGLTKAERAEYNARARRIGELELELSINAAKAERERQWNGKSETDTPQIEARQSYRDRETNFEKQAGNERIELDSRNSK